MCRLAVTFLLTFEQLTMYLGEELSRGFAGEGHRHHKTRLNLFFRQETQIAFGQNCCLARSRPCQDNLTAAQIQSRLLRFGEVNFI